MKRSEFESKVRSCTAEPWTDTSYGADQVLALVAQVGVTWDPEEPEALWEAPETVDVYATRILIDGTIEYLSSLRGWLPMDCPTTRELARRLLAERAEKAKQDVMQHSVLAGLAADKDHVTDGSSCWCNPVTEKPGIEDVPDGDMAAVSGTAAWIERERACRDLDGEVRSEEAAGRRRIAKILKASRSSYWYARHIGKVFEVELVEAEGLFKGSARVAGYCGGHYVQPEDMEYLEFLDLGS